MMELDPAPILGVLGALAGIANTIPYIRNTLRGSTRPHRGTWLIWAILAVVACLSQRAAGASWSMIMTATQAILTAVIFVLATRYGQGGIDTRDMSLIAIAVAGVAGCVLAHQPTVAIACVIAADLTALAMMTPKAYHDPYSETLTTYALASVGGALAASAVETPDPSLLAYPIYYCVINAATATLLHRRRAALAEPPAA
jgi:alkylhydroperoxidase/carboxymuconolactone decarboxylase family protein YurZ